MVEHHEMGTSARTVIQRRHTVSDVREIRGGTKPDMRDYLMKMYANEMEWNWSYQKTEGKNCCNFCLKILYFILQHNSVNSVVGIIWSSDKDILFSSYSPYELIDLFK